MPLFAALLACSSPDPAPSPPPAPAAAVSAPAGPPAAGIIGGEPILPRPMILGALDPAALEAGLAPERASIRSCFDAGRATRPDLAGKVLVRFTVAHGGAVTGAATASTSLRHPPTEDCVVASVARARFAPLTDGETAIVAYPFVFP